MRLGSPAVAAAVLAAALPVAAQDVTIVSKVTRDGGPPTTATSYLSADHARIVQAEGQEAIVDLKTGQMTVIDGRKKEYFVVTRQDMDQMKAQLEQTMNSPEMLKAQEQMKNLPPEIQKKMQGAMGMLGSIDVQKTGATKKVAGYNCEVWTLSMGQISKTEQCLSTELPLPAQTWDAYRDFAEGMKSMLAAMGPMGKGMAGIQEKMKDMRGFPLSSTTSVNLMGKTSTTTTEVVEVKKGAIPASAWEVPAGYSKVASPMAKLQQRPR